MRLQTSRNDNLSIQVLTDILLWTAVFAAGPMTLGSKRRRVSASSYLYRTLWYSPSVCIPQGAKHARAETWRKVIGTRKWRKSVGVEPTRHVERVSLDLKSRRPTGVRSSSSIMSPHCPSQMDSKHRHASVFRHRFGPSDRFGRSIPADRPQSFCPVWRNLGTQRQ